MDTLRASPAIVCQRGQRLAALARKLMKRSIVSSDIAPAFFLEPPESATEVEYLTSQRRKNDRPHRQFQCDLIFESAELDGSRVEFSAHLMTRKCEDIVTYEMPSSELVRTVRNLWGKSRAPVPQAIVHALSFVAHARQKMGPVMKKRVLHLIYKRYID
jgi:hypothetical protein